MPKREGCLFLPWSCVYIKHYYIFIVHILHWYKYTEVTTDKGDQDLILFTVKEKSLHVYLHVYKCSCIHIFVCISDIVNFCFL